MWHGVEITKFFKRPVIFNTLTDISQTENDLNLISRFSTKATGFF